MLPHPWWPGCYKTCSCLYMPQGPHAGSSSSWPLPLLLLLSAVTLGHIGSAAASYSAWHECSAQSIYGGAYGRQALTSLQDFRSQLLTHVWKTFDPLLPAPMGFDRFKHLRPFLRCPPHQPLVRYGSKEDGGKLLCDVSQLAPPCLIYSLGSNGDYSFEHDMLNVTKCEIHTFDCTYKGASQHPKRHFYHQWCVGAKKAPNFKTWEQITQELGHTQRTLEIFKVDIEGHEPGVIAELRHNLPLPRQIVMEIHMRPVAGTMIQRPAPRTPAQLALLMLHLASLGYGIVGQEDNIWGEGAQTGQGCCAEWTFLHVEQPWVGPGARGIATSRHKRQGLGALGLRGGRHFLVQQRAAAQMHDEQQLAEAEHKQQEQQQQQSAGDPEEVPLLLEAAEVQLQQQNQLAELLLQEPQQAAASDLPAVSTP